MPTLRADKTTRKGVRRGNIKYLCQNCRHWFQIKRTRTKPSSSTFLFSHLRGVSFRSLGETYGIHQSTAYRRTVKALDNLPHCADITRRYCTRFCGILVVDGKYVKVKGYERKIPVLYGIDYLTHDISTYTLSESESYNSHLEGRLKTIKGFESFKHADSWLNGYFLKRRLKPFTDCTKQFKKLNGTASLEHSVTQHSSFDYLSKLLR